MFSVKGDTVLDPFLGTGTTTLAAMAACRNSVGFEIEPNFQNPIVSQMDTAVPFSNQHIRNRIDTHIDFVTDRMKTKGAFKYKNKHYGFPVITSQEQELLFNQLLSVTEISDNTFEVIYSEMPQEEFCQDWEKFIIPQADKPTSKRPLSKTAIDKATRLTSSD